MSVELAGGGFGVDLTNAIIFTSNNNIAHHHSVQKHICWKMLNTHHKITFLLIASSIGKGDVLKFGLSTTTL